MRSGWHATERPEEILIRRGGLKDNGACEQVKSTPRGVGVWQGFVPERAIWNRRTFIVSFTMESDMLLLSEMAKGDFELNSTTKALFKTPFYCDG
jgi:hypothetical protein